MTAPAARTAIGLPVRACLPRCGAPIRPPLTSTKSLPQRKSRADSLGKNERGEEGGGRGVRR